MAIENTIAGSLLPNYELLKEHKLPIAGEYKLRVSHCLAALPGQTIHDIKEVQSHPIALMQCADFLGTLPGVKVVEHEDTALAARDIAKDKVMGTAAICSVRAAEIYGLNVLAQGIETNKRNFTRFLILETIGWWTKYKKMILSIKPLLFSLCHIQKEVCRKCCRFSLFTEST